MDWSSNGLLIGAGVLALAALLLTVFIVLRVLKKPRLSSLSLRLLEITLPRVVEGDRALQLESIGLSEQLFSALSSLHQPFVFEVAVHHSGEEIHFYLAVPRAQVTFATEQVEALFPDAQVREVSDYTIMHHMGVARGAYLSQKDAFVLPIRTYREAGTDTFAGILSTLSRLSEVGEGAAVQFLVRPADASVKRRILNAITSLKKGFPLSDILRTDMIKFSDVVEVLGPSKHSEGPVIVDEEAVSVLESKVSHPLLSVSVRIVVSAETEGRAVDTLATIASSFSQFSATRRNSFVVVEPRNQKDLIFSYIFREWRTHESMVLSSEELASIFHLPIAASGVPRIAWLSSREVAPPPSFASSGVIIGESLFRGEHKIVQFSDDDRRRHLYLVGQTGTGKSHLLRTLASQDIQKGAGVCVIDPHGDLINEVLATIPRERIDDVIVFDPGDLTRPLGMNMLEYDRTRPEEKTFIVNELQSIFNRLFTAETMGPMFEQYMRNALLLLMEDDEEISTLVDVPRVFTDPEFRKRKLSRVKNPVVIDFWEKEASKTSGEQGLANMTPYITSKFNNFVANDYMRPIIGQETSSFNFRTVMDEGKILLVSLAKGRIGDINAGLLGMIVTGRILLSALARTDQDEALRRDFYLYIDEFQNFTTDSIGVILSEARKYKLNLILAHQFIAQLSEPIKGAVFGNVGSLAIFRVGADDAEYLQGQVSPEFSTADLVGLENRTAVLKLLVNGEPARPFNIRTLPAPSGSVEVRDKLKELSRLTYGRDFATVEAQILSRLRS